MGRDVAVILGRVCSLAALLSVGGWTLGQDPPPEVLRYADLILYNGQILTMDQDRPPIRTVEAVAVRDGRILATGASGRIRAMAGPETVRVDLAGRAVLPGVIDTHSHPNSYALFHRDQARAVNQGYVKFLEENHVSYTNARWTSKEAALEDLERFASSAPAGNWIFTSIGIDENLFKVLNEFTKSDLDRVVPDHPLFIMSGYGLWGLVNSRMLEVIRDLYGEKLIPGFVRDTRGEPTGQLLGAAGETIDMEVLPQRPPELVAPYFKNELEEWVARGITTISTRLKGYEISAYSLLDRRGELPVRIAYTHEIGRANPHLERDLRRMGNIQGHGTNRIWNVGITVGNPDGYGPSPKLAEDSVWVGEVSCVSLEKKEVLPNDLYPENLCMWDLPGAPGPDAAVLANRYGYRVAGVHTFGDKGIEDILDSYRRADAESSLKGKRFSLDHGMMIRPDLREITGDLDISWSFQPTLFWRRYGAGVSQVYGEEYAHQWLFPVKSVLDQGVRVSYGADTHNDPERYPLFGLEVLVTRKTRDGRVFGARERIDRATALLMMTRGGAYYVLRENELGSIEPGKLADLIVLERNPLDPAIQDEDLSEIEFVATILDGKVVAGSLEP